MAGRKISSNTLILLDLFDKNKNLILQNDKVIAPSSDVWLKIISDYELKISAKNLYTRALTYFKKKGEKNYCQTHCKSHSESSTTSSSSSSSVQFSSNSSETDKSHLNIRYFKIFIPIDQWNTIKPQLVTYNVKHNLKGCTGIKQRNYLKLQRKYWTNIFSKAIWSTIKDQCVWKFNSQYIFNEIDSPKCLKIKGVCTECSAVLYCNLDNVDDLKENADGIFINCSIRGALNIPHKKKRRLYGIDRQMKRIEMIETNKPASLVRKTMAGQLGELFQKEPPILPRLEVLRQAKAEFANKDRVHADPIQALFIMAQKNPLKYIIHEIAIFKFYIHYWSPDQTRVYNQYCKIHKHPKVCIDATGSVVRKLAREDNGLSGHIFLYAIVIKLPNEHEGQISIAQMLSERNNSNAIHYWLSEWHRLGARQPHEIVCDFSMALLSAVCRTFSGCSDLVTYINNCVKVILQNNYIFLPQCFIRVDVAHLIKMVCRWREIHPSNINNRSKIRQFYIRGVGQMLLSTHLDEAMNILKSLFITALSQYEGNLENSNQGTTCEIHKKKLLNKYAHGIQQSAVNDIIVEMDVDIDNVERDNISAKPSQSQSDQDEHNIIHDLIEKIYNEALIAVADETGDRDNVMYLPSIIRPLKLLCSRIPLWSGIMIEHFHYGTLTASSTNVESYFNDLKTRNFTNLPLRVDQFVVEHTRILENTMRLASGLNYFHNNQNELQTNNESEETPYKQQIQIPSLNMEMIGNKDDHDDAEIQREKIQTHCQNMEIIGNKDDEDDNRKDTLSSNQARKEMNYIDKWKRKSHPNNKGIKKKNEVYI